LYRVITLEDIYLPLSLSYLPLSLSNDNSINGTPYDEIIRRIDAKIAELEAEEANRTDTVSTGGSNNILNIYPQNPSDVNSSQTDDDTIDELLRQIDAKIAELEAEEAQDSMDESPHEMSCKIETGLRLLIEANPGSGKTTFCKRFVLAIINNDELFFRKYSTENKLIFNMNALPVLISCKNVEDLSENDCFSLSFPQLMYRLCAQSIGHHFVSISENDFIELLKSYDYNNVCIILDGWDEILDSKKADLFNNKLNNFLELYPESDIIITIRARYVAPKLFQPYSGRYGIEPLSTEDIRQFCQKWCEIIFNQNQHRANNYETISEQILSSKEQQVIAMRRNPLDLSLLLTVSKNSGRLPENKAELFKSLVDLYIFWHTNKSKGMLSSKSIRIFLAYIASIFTKSQKLYCNEAELLQIIEQAISDLEWAFTEDTVNFEANIIAKELSHTGILVKTWDAKYSFSENPQFTHRQMQEYLTAYAILAQYSDKEYNNMPCADIFEDKYGNRQWREVIVFVSLMNIGRLRQEIIKRIIIKAEEKPDDNYVYTNLLFDLIVNGAEIETSDKHRSYDIIFSRHITDQQIPKIFQLVSSGSKNASDFISYIDSKFSDSVRNSDSEYGFAQAVIKASDALQQGVSPFKKAEALMRSDNEEDIIAGSQIVLIIAWCKYANINNNFSSYADDFKISAEWIELYNSLIKMPQLTNDLLKSIREAIIADFAVFYDFFGNKTLQSYALQLNEDENVSNCELVLSIAPIFDHTFQYITAINDHTKMKYLKKLDDEIKSNAYNDIIFTFSICVAIGCFSIAERDEKWEELTKYYDELKDEGSVGIARYHQLEKSLHIVELSERSDRLQQLQATDYLQENKSNSGINTKLNKIAQDKYSSKTEEEISSQDSMFFTILDDNGKENRYEVLFTFDSDETGKSYMVYTDDSVDENGNTRVFASTYISNSEETELLPIETDKEWKVIETILNEIQNANKNEKE